MDNPVFFTSQGKGVPLIFQHGLGAEQSQILSLLGDLQGIELICSDSRGHGQSTLHPDARPSFDLYADDIVSLMNDLGHNKFIMGGLSMGAGISLNLTSKFPEKVKALILLRPAWLMAPDPPNLQILLKVSEYLRQGLDRKQLETDPDFQKIFNGLPNAAASVLNLFNRQRSIWQVLESMVHDSPVTSPPNTDIPILIIGNENDPLHPISVAQYWHDMLPGSILKTVTSRYLDDEKHKIEVKRHIQDFLTKLIL